MKARYLVAGLILSVTPVMSATYDYQVVSLFDVADEEPLVFIEGLGFRRLGEDDCYSSKLGEPIPCDVTEEAKVRPKPRPCEPLPVCLIPTLFGWDTPVRTATPTLQVTPNVSITPRPTDPRWPAIPQPFYPPVFPPIVYPPVDPKPPVGPDPPTVPIIPLPATGWLLIGGLLGLMSIRRRKKA
ncbi:MAG: VPLPA-CTERM sorting domain-containing protein [Anaerolineaceae bacterium]